MNHPERFCTCNAHERDPSSNYRHLTWARAKKQSPFHRKVRVIVPTIIKSGLKVRPACMVAAGNVSGQAGWCDALIFHC